MNPESKVDQPATDAAPDQVVKSRRGRETMFDMVRSMGLLIVVIGLLLVVTPARQLIFASGSDVRPMITDAEQLQEWQALTGHPALLPTAAQGWPLNSARMSGEQPNDAHLHLGWVTPGKQYVGLDQSLLPPAKLWRSVLGSGSKPVGTVGISGHTWEIRSDKYNDVVLSHTSGGLTTVLVGSVSPDQLQSVASSLVPGASSLGSAASSG